MNNTKVMLSRESCKYKTLEDGHVVVVLQVVVETRYNGLLHSLD